MVEDLQMAACCFNQKNNLCLVSESSKRGNPGGLFEYLNSPGIFPSDRTRAIFQVASVDGDTFLAAGDTHANSGVLYVACCGIGAREQW